jgi:hypothetical protein
MKKILIPLNILSLCVIAVLLLSNKEKTAETLKKENLCDSNICMNYSRGGQLHYLDANMLRMMKNEYKRPTSTSAFASSLRIPTDDADNIWFSLDSLKHFIWEIETKACSTNCSGNNTKLNLGLRIYYARYPSVAGMKATLDLAGLDSKYAEHHTLFMIPTYDNPIDPNMHIDFDPSQYSKSEKKGDCKYRSLNEFNGQILAFGFKIQKKQNKTSPYSIGSTASSTNASTNALNHGGLCPPLICNPGAAF